MDSINRSQVIAVVDGWLSSMRAMIDTNFSPDPPDSFVGWVQRAGEPPSERAIAMSTVERAFGALQDWAEGADGETLDALHAAYDDAAPKVGMPCIRIRFVGGPYWAIDEI